MNTLVELHKKNNHTTDKHGVHSYLTTYDKLFSRLKERNNKILEIGVYKGDSLNLWAEYFTNSQIYGIDKDTSQINVKLNDRVQVMQKDAYRNLTVDRLREIGKFDVIIDDGCHVVEKQKYVITNYLELLTKDGILIIEDITIGVANSCCVSHINKLIKLFPKNMKHYVTCVDERRDDLQNNFLLVFNKGKKS